jgi:hypothetical protein
LAVDERARGEPGQPPPLVTAQLADEAQSGEQLVLIDTGRPQFKILDHRGEELAAGAAAVGDEQIKMTSLGGSDDALRALAVNAQPLDPDPPLDQPQHITTRIVRFQDHAGEVDESTDRCLRVAAGATLELLALALRCAVGAAERPVVDLDRVVGRALERLDAERHQHREAPLWRHPGERLIGLLPAGLRQPSAPVRRQPFEIEPVRA